MKKWWLSLILIPAGLELNMRMAQTCPEYERGFPCRQFSHQPPGTFAEREARILALQELRAQNKHLSASEYQEHAAALLIEVSDPGFRYNGVACFSNGTILLRADLPPRAKRYVQQHELEHFITPDASETAVNYAAAKVQPLGMIVTVFSSVSSAFLRSENYRCTLAGLWRTFHTYFLGASHQ